MSNNRKVKKCDREIDIDQIITSKGIDIYHYIQQEPYDKQKLTTLLTLTPEAQELFRKENQKAYSFLKRNSSRLQPLLEEGFCNTETDREFKGEYYIVPEAAALIIFKKIILKHHNDSNVNTKNIVFAQLGKKNDIKKYVDLKEGEDIKICLANEENVHLTPIYIRKEGGQIKCFVSDSFGGNKGSVSLINSSSHLYRVKNMLINTFGKDIKFFYSSDEIQRDYYTCATHAIKYTLYFCKHGKDLFREIERNAEPARDTLFGVNIPNSYCIKKGGVPAKMLKFMDQKFLVADDSKMSSIVSKNKNLTLEGYINKYKLITNDNKQFTTVPIIKKKKYITILNDILSQNNTSEQSIINSMYSANIALRDDIIAKELDTGIQLIR